VRAIRFLAVHEGELSLLEEGLQAELEVGCSTEFEMAKTAARRDCGDAQVAALYIECVRLALFRRPIPGTAEISASQLGLSGEKRYFGVVELAGTLGMYATKVDGADMHILVAPLAVISFIARECKIDRLLFLHSVADLHKNSTGEEFERVANLVVRLRLSDSFVSTEDRPWLEMLPFLEGTPFEQMKQALAPSNERAKSFPKVTTKATEMTDSVFRQSFRAYLCGDGKCALSTVHPTNVPAAVEMLALGVLYFPDPQSSSADMFIRVLLGMLLIQWKHGKQQVDPPMIRDEVKKGPLSANKESVLVIVCDGGIAPVLKKVINVLPAPQHRHTHAILQAGDTLPTISYTIPKNVTVVVLTQSGLSEFLTPILLAALQSDAPSTEALWSTIASPPKWQTVQSSGRIPSCDGFSFGRQG
jgi:hypothetical protein